MRIKSFCQTALAATTLSLIPAFSQDAVPPVAEASADAAAGDKDGESAAQAAAMKKIEDLGWTRTGKAKIGNRSEIEVPEGLQITGAQGAQKLLRMFNNIPSGKELAILSTADLAWWADFTFTDEGYVKDDEKGEIDADKLLENLKEGQIENNKVRKKQGLNPFLLTGWSVKPFYNEESKSLEFGFKIKEDVPGEQGESVNYSTKILGRHGVMNVTLVCAPEALDSSLAELRGALKGFAYVSGESYAEYRKGDKVAEYGLTALIAGGTLAVAAKTGLLGKLIKPIIFVVVALGAVLKKFFGKLTGRGQS